MGKEHVVVFAYGIERINRLLHEAAIGLVWSDVGGEVALVPRRQGSKWPGAHRGPISSHEFEHGGARGKRGTRGARKQKWVIRRHFEAERGARHQRDAHFGGRYGLEG